MQASRQTVLTIIVLGAIILAIVFLETRHAGPRALIPGSADVTPGALESVGTSTANAARIAEKKLRYAPAKEITEPTGFINTEPFTIQSLVGKKVVLLDFWTYSCINCIRTLPYVEAWAQKYQDAGLVVVGIHTPEFDFEKVFANVEMAVKKFGITYPVVLDSQYGTWSAYGNNYWPQDYLIDIDGFIADSHIGEGDYAQTEEEIQNLLAERNSVLGLHTPIPTGVVRPASETVNESLPLSPETYFGSARNEYLGNGTIEKQQVADFKLPKDISAPNVFYLSGTWDIESQYAETKAAGAGIAYNYEAQNLYFVAAAQGSSALLRVLVDGKPISSDMRGGDVGPDGLLRINENRLYSVVKASAWGTHHIELQLESGILRAFTFTFG
ncbi:MAG: redoxin domain-containing protein [Patescibacteria group bacterium]|nr:redoxin domain-containing protein [Patescibacteria group bacterium]